MADTGPHNDPAWGKKHLNIEGYYRTYQVRVSPDAEFGNEDRKWRAQWLKDQVLKGADVHSPRTGEGLNQYQLEQNPEYRKARYSILRRTVRAQMDFIEGAFIKATGVHWLKARWMRDAFGYSWKVGFVFWAMSYHLMYRANDWENRKNWKIYYEKPAIVPGQSSWPEQKHEKGEHASDYADQNFKKSTLYEANIKASTKNHC